MELDLEKILESEQAWEYVLLDIVKSEELDPWDIDITKLTSKYLERIRKMEGDPDLRVPARLILAAAVLLKMQSAQLMPIEEEESLLDLPLFGDDFDMDMYEGEGRDELPMLDLHVRRKPIRKITLEDLIKTLQKSMAPKIPKEKTQHVVLEIPEVDITDQIDDLYKAIISHNLKKLPFSKLISSKKREEVMDALLPLLYLANDRKIGLDQKEFFKEIFVMVDEKAK